MSLNCSICRLKYDQQFISRYLTLNKQQQVYICEQCYTELSEYDEGMNELFITVNNLKFFNAGINI